MSDLSKRIARGGTARLCARISGIRNAIDAARAWGARFGVAMRRTGGRARAAGLKLAASFKSNGARIGAFARANAARLAARMRSKSARARAGMCKGGRPANQKDGPGLARARAGMRRAGANFAARMRAASGGVAARASRLWKWTRGHAGRAAYYGAIAIALCAVGWAAEQYRTENPSETDALILPAADVQLALPAKPEAKIYLPEGAEALRAYAATPEWNGALGLWAAHTGVDYFLPGGAVESLSAGTVRTVGESGIYGGFVEVESGEYLLRYASIAPDAALVPGAEIAAGARIGTADNSMPAEANMGAHLHLELERAGKNVDFARWAEKKEAAAD